ncbi:MAG: alpha/beta hydrolase [Steroidobacteraceae bacterium]|jgi:pimeloyl-ACP methyl ester carboxylesterase
MDAPALVYVHGLWLTGHEAFLLRRRLVRDRGYDWHSFTYRSQSSSMTAVAEALARHIDSLKVSRLHLIGHSLGGLVILRALSAHGSFPPGRVVFLGSPCVASSAATRVARFRFGRAILGQAGSEELLNAQVRRWEGTRDLGIIAGTQSLSIGRLVTDFTEENDGTVAVSETQLPGATAHLILPVSHTGMLLSARVAKETGSFLEHGRFGS